MDGCGFCYENCWLAVGLTVQIQSVVAQHKKLPVAPDGQACSALSTKEENLCICAALYINNCLVIINPENSLLP